MSDSDLQLRRRLTAISDDAPAEASVIMTVQAGYRRHLRRRRWYAAASAAAVVLLVSGATTLLRPDQAPATREVSSDPAATLGTRATPTTIELTATSKLTTFAGFSVISPVSVPDSSVSFDQDGPDVTSDSAHLEVNWTGKSPTAMETLDVRSGTTGSGQYRGYLITATAPALEVYAPGYDTKSASETITVNGHPARLLTAPKGSFDNTYATPAAVRIAWQLADRRWIQVWAVGEDRSVLIGFASSIKTVPTVFPTGLHVGLTVRGYTSADASISSFVSQMVGPMLSLCRARRTDTDERKCLGVSVSVADGGFVQSLVQGSESEQQFWADTAVLTVDGIAVSVNHKLQVAWAKWGKATIILSAPSDNALSASDLAALAASVHLDPTLLVENQPNPVVESSLAQASADRTAVSSATR